MRVKIGNTWYKVEDDQAIMIEFESEEEQKNQIQHFLYITDDDKRQHVMCKESCMTQDHEVYNWTKDNAA